MNNNEIKVNIILPIIGNTGTDFLKTVRAILDQSYKKYCLTIISDLSIDKLFLISPEIKDNTKVRTISEQSLNYAEAVRKASLECSSEYILLTNEKVFFDKDYLQTLVNYTEVRPGADLCYGLLNAGKSEDQEYKFAHSPISKLSRFLANHNYAPIVFGIFKKQAFIDSLPQINDAEFFYSSLIANFFIKKYTVDFTNAWLEYQFDNKEMEISYLKSYFNFHKCVLENFIKNYKPTANQIVFLRSISIHGFLKKSIEISNWLKASDKESIYRSAIEKATIDFPRLGNFKTDEPDNIRFEPILNRNLLAINITCLEALLQNIDENKNPELWQSIYSELETVRKDKKRTEEQINKVPEIISEQLRQIPLLNPNKKPKATIITLSKNLANLVEETILSVSNQNFDDYEFIIVDGGSTDGTQDIVKKYPNIILISEKDRNTVDAMWKGFKLARGEYILQCAVSDSYASFDWVKKCIETLENNKDVSLIWGLSCSINNDCKMVNIGYPDLFYNEAPQRDDMFYFWIKTFRHYPEVNLCVKKSVLLKCYPSLDDYMKYDILDWLEFSYRFNSLGYLSIHLPVLANFYHINHGEQLGHSMELSGKLKRMNIDYQKKIKKYKWKMIARSIVGLQGHVFIDSQGNKLDIKFRRKQMMHEYLLPKILEIFGLKKHLNN